MALLVQETSQPRVCSENQAEEAGELLDIAATLNLRIELPVGRRALLDYLLCLIMET